MFCFAFTLLLSFPLNTFLHEIIYKVDNTVQYDSNFQYNIKSINSTEI